MAAQILRFTDYTNGSPERMLHRVPHSGSVAPLKPGDRWTGVGPVGVRGDTNKKNTRCLGKVFDDFDHGTGALA